MRRTLPLVLFVLAGSAGWLLIWSAPDQPHHDDHEPEPEAPLTAPPVVLAKPAVPPTAPTEKAVDGAANGPAQRQDEPEADPPSHRNPGPDETPSAPPSPNEILQLPPHLQTASDEAKRGHYAELLSHNKALMEFAQRDQKRITREASARQIRKQQEEMRLFSEHVEAQDELLRTEIARLGGPDE